MPEDSDSDGPKRPRTRVIRQQQRQDAKDKATFFAGTTVLMKLTVAPFERVKLLLQCQGELLRAGRIEKPYLGAVHCAKRIVQHEGFRGLWRGNLAATIFQVAHSIKYVALRESMMPYLVPRREHSHLRNFTRNVFLGGAVGLLSLSSVYSIDYVRTRLANDVRMAELGVQRQFKGTLDVYRQTLRTDGITGLYRGFGLACGGIVLYRAIYFGTFETVQELLIEKEFQPKYAYTLAYFVSILVGMGVYPLDTVRRRLIMTSGKSLGSHSHRYRSSLECLGSIRELEGGRSLWRGMGTHMVAGVIGTVVLITLEVARKILSRWDEDDD